MWQPPLLVAPLTAASAPAWPRMPTLHGEVVVSSTVGCLREAGTDGVEACEDAALDHLGEAP